MINLIEKATEKVTDKQIEKFKNKTGLQGMDSTQIQSNIQNMSRVQLLAEIIHRLHRILSNGDKEKYTENFSTYIKEDALHYVYRLKRDETKTRLEEIGEDLALFIKEFKENYKERIAYKNLVKVFNEHYRYEEEKIIIKQGKELRGSIFQSPDDLDNLPERTYIEEIVTDAGYIGPTGSESTEKHGIKHSVTALRGRKKDESKFSLYDFKIEKDNEGIPVSIECPNEVAGEVKRRKPGRYSAGFDSSACDICPFNDKCFAKKLKKKDLSIIRFTDDNIRVALQRQQYKESKDNFNIRASVESTV